MAHRDGYNVLYGDAHATWYGDAQQLLIWRDQGTGSSTWPCVMPWSPWWDTDMLGNQVWMPGQAGGPYAIFRDRFDYQSWTYSSAAIWHELDVVAGVDVDVPPERSPWWTP